MATRNIQYALISLLAGFLCLMVWYNIPKDLECEVKDLPVAEYDSSSDTLLAGQKIFKSLCAACHKLEGKLIGPPLLGVEQRWMDAGEYQGISGRDWLKRYIRNWKEPVEAGYPYAKAIIAFDASAMTQFPQLSDADIELILLYLQNPPKQKPIPMPTAEAK